MNLTRAELRAALEKARQIIAERGQVSDEWNRAFFAIERALVERLWERWDGKVRPTKFLGKALRGLGYTEAVAAKVLTAIGEALESLEKRTLVVARGDELGKWYERFGYYDGLRSCMTGHKRSYISLYTEHPEIVSLWVLVDEEGLPLARALMWEKALVKVGGEFREARILDRVYGVSYDAREKLVKLAKESGAWVKSEQSFHELTWNKPLVSPDGEEAIVARVYPDWHAGMHPDDVRFPYMDTFKFLRFADDGRMILSSKPPRSGPYAKLENTDGWWSSYRGFDERWRELRDGAALRPREEREEHEEEGDGDFVCDECGGPVDEDDVHFYDNRPYCPDCFYESFFYCDACGEVHSRDYGYRVDDYMYCEECFDRNYVVCERCGEVVDRDNVRWLDDEPYCEGCYERVAASCDHCGETFHTYDLHYLPYEEMHVCGDCFHEHTAACVMCGERILTTQRRGRYLVNTPIAVRESGIMGHVCNTCLDDLVQNRGYERCPGCERYVHPDHFHDGECDECRTVEEVAREVCGSEEEVEA